MSRSGPTQATSTTRSAERPTIKPRSSHRRERATRRRPDRPAFCAPALGPAPQVMCYKSAAAIYSHCTYCACAVVVLPGITA
ncbi:hypothetical protein EVAR_88711_1 [Eumeta japonica]|uniref:Uncharacterized protein n=1 Tax=Eumeta variegata TaxID=151549 RepID=A0A4C1XEC6_EUMVA|nr:hypothetical protein EVAR_88711_1 [Eumeta japonica]